MFDPAEIAIEIARIERECLRAVLAKIASRQLGEAFADLEEPQPLLEAA